MAMQLTKNVYVCTEFQGANVGYVTTEEGIVMIESPFKPSDAIKWRKEIESKGTIKYLINTEPHDDHITGDFFFNVPVIAQDKAGEVMVNADVKRMIQTVSVIDPGSEALVKGYEVRTPSITFGEEMSLYLGKHTFKLVHLPGHTLGELSVYIPEERVVFTGDNITYKMQGFLHEIEIPGWLNSLKRIGEFDVDHIVPGHGGVCDKTYLPVQARFIEASIATIKDAIKKGWTRQEAVARINSFPSPYQFDEGTKEIAPMFMQMAINRMYDLLSK
jgi:cyclase